MTANRVNDVSDEYVQWAACSYQPYFRKMMKKSNSNMQVMDRKTVPQKLAKKAPEMKAILVETLSDNHHALTSDHWTSLSK